MDWINSTWGLKFPNSCKVAQVMQGLLFPVWLNTSNKMWNFFLELLSSARKCCKEGGPHVQEQERKWAEHVKPLLLGCLPQRWEVCSLCVCSDNLLLPCPLRYLLAADTGVMWRPCFQGRCDSLISCSFLACVRVCARLCVCVCQGEILGSICTASPAMPWPSVFSFLSCVTQQVVLCCAVRIAQQCLREGTNSKRALPSSGK